MAGNVLSFIISAKDHATSVFGRVSGAVTGFVNRLASLQLATQFVGRVWRALTQRIAGTVGEFMGFERQVAKLSAALRISGDYSEWVVQGYKDFADAIQKVTIYSNTAILQTMAYAKSMGIETRYLKDATTAAIGLAGAYGIDLTTAMMLVARAQMGQTQMLTRYGIVLDDTLSPLQKFEELLRIGASRFSLATAEANTSYGALERLKNVWSDVRRGFGTKVAEGLGLSDIFQGLIVGLQKVEGWIWENETIQQFFSDLRDKATAVGGVLATLMKGGPEAAGTLSGIGDILKFSLQAGAEIVRDLIAEGFQAGWEKLKATPLGRWLEEQGGRVAAATGAVRGAAAFWGGLLGGRSVQAGLEQMGNAGTGAGGNESPAKVEIMGPPLPTAMDKLRTAIDTLATVTEENRDAIKDSMTERTYNFAQMKPLGDWMKPTAEPSLPGGSPAIGSDKYLTWFVNQGLSKMREKWSGRPGAGAGSVLSRWMGGQDSAALFSAYAAGGPDMGGLRDAEREEKKLQKAITRAQRKQERLLGAGHGGGALGGGGRLSRRDQLLLAAVEKQKKEEEMAAAEKQMRADNHDNIKKIKEAVFNPWPAEG